QLLVHLVREVRVERAAVDGPLAGARGDADAGDGLLAPAGGRGGLDVRDARRRRLGGVALDGGLVGVDLVDGDLSHVLTHCATWPISNGTGCWAWCGCSGPAYTFSLDSICRPRLLCGSIPLTAFSMARRGFFSRRSRYVVERRPPGRPECR